MKLLSHTLLFVLLVASGRAVEPTDLGSNLTYLRVHALAEAAPTLSAALAAKNACILDLRFVTPSEEPPSALRTALAGHPADNRLYILVSPATPASVVDVINSAGPATPITLGIPGSNPAPRIVIRTDAATDRQAYEAFDKGTPLADLISGKIEKDRFDEATLVQEFKNGNPDPESAAPDVAKKKTGAETDNSSEPATVVAAPLKDRVLQGALHLHQALLALRR